MTDSELLVEIETAISAALKGKSVSVDGQSYTSQDVSVLYKLRKEVTKRIAQAAETTRSVSYADLSYPWD